MIFERDKNPSFFNAAEDLRYLLSKGYPRTGALTFVGNRYQLPKSEREIIGRGVYPGEEALRRRNRLLSPEAIKGRAIGLDGYNVIITLESALLGRDLIACDDGPIRDAAWVSSSFRPSEVTEDVLELILDYLYGKGALSIVFYLYAPMSHSGDLALHISSILSGKGVMGRAQAVPSPKVELRAFPGITCTSDSILIEQVQEPIDLAGNIIIDMMPDLHFVELGLFSSLKTGLPVKLL